jgi:LDH2 family malate/lactate/ureidoglycolate dehydrogenase
MPETIVRIPLPALKTFMTDVFRGLGVPPDDAELCADNLCTADRLGIDSHGINRLKLIYFDRIRQGIQEPVTKFEIVREGPTTAVIDGHNGMGHVIGYKAMSMAIEKAKKFGLGMTVVRNSTHYGIAGYYPLMAAHHDQIGITGTNARPSIAPTFGTENMLGTNPLTFGMPSDEPFPFLLDCATSITQRGKIEVYAKNGKSCPPGWVTTRDGGTMTDSAEILQALTKDTAALLPIGGPGEDMAGYKGYGYATVVEILSAALQNGAFLKALSGIDNQGKKGPYRLGHFFMAIDITAFIDPSEFKRITGDILRSLRASRKAPGQERIYTAGEKEYLTSLDRTANGVPVNEELQGEIRAMVKELGLKGQPFPFL